MNEDNPALSAIANRSSIRSYKDRPVPRELVVAVLRAGMAAPSGRNVQPWAFLVVDDRGVLAELAAVLPHGSPLREAPLAVMVGADMILAEAGTPGYDYWIQDCSAATQNMLLAAEAVGLGAVWLGVTPVPERVEKVSGILRLPENIAPLCIVAMGYPGEPGRPKDKFREDRIHWGKW